jgi:glycosyltransferase involved in cell wall biosynthesis
VTAGAVSVVVPVHDGERYLGAAVDSILVQTAPPSEVIVVDDGSTDRTPAVVTAYGARVTAMRLPKGNTSTALNRGIARAGGEYLAFLDADDLWLPDKLAQQVGVLDDRPDVDVVFGMVQQFVTPEADPQLARRIQCPAAPQPGILRSAMLVRRAAFDRVGPFDERLGVAEFVDWYARALGARLGVHMLDAVVAHRRLHGANKGIRDGLAQRENCLDILKASLDGRRRGGPERPA